MKNYHEIKAGDIVTIRFIEWNYRGEGFRYISTRQDGTAYTVKKKYGELGVDYPKFDTESGKYIPDFVPFRGFASTVHFFKESGERFAFNNLTERIEEVLA